MELLSLKPGAKLRTKFYLILFSIILLEIIIGVILQIIIPLGGEATAGEVAIILWPIIIVIALLILLITVPIGILWINNLNYIIDFERISIHKGIITKIQQNIPYRAITDFMLHRSLFDRILGIASIRIQTAGQSVTPTGYEGNLAGIVDWTKLLDELRARLKKENSLSFKNNEDNNIIGDEDKLSAIVSELKEIKELLRNRN